MTNKLRRIEGEVPAVKPLGRHLFHDERNLDYPIRELLPKRITPVRKLWWTQDVYNQGGSSCTMQAASGILVTSPFRLNTAIRATFPHHDTEAERHALYLRGQGYDPWPGGEPQYEGSSTDAPFRLMRELGWIGEWRWVFGLQDLIDTVMFYGPAAVGTIWTERMFYPDASGRIKPEGEISGGHAYRVIGVDPIRRVFICVNSWDRTWGRSGRFEVSYEDMDYLLGQDGEAVTVVL